jgi:hypothetical protein
VSEHYCDYKWLCARSHDSFHEEAGSFHEDHGAEENWRFARKWIAAGAKRPNHPSCFFVKTFLLLRD